MAQITIIEVADKSHIQRVAECARNVWTAHFTPIIGAEQVDYMLEKFQSHEAISVQIGEQGYAYYLALYEGEDAGYCAVVAQPEKRQLHLSKMYVKPALQGRGIGGALFAYTQRLAVQRRYGRIWLRVNRFNTRVIRIYQHMGFDICDTHREKIGGGFVMDDYIMEKRFSVPEDV